MSEHTLGPGRTVTLPRAVYDKLAKRHTATCPLCPATFVRAKREAAEFARVQHVNYNHTGPA